jgi:hypothetical protein
MGAHKNAEDMADILVDIYRKEFGGKKFSRYQISRSQFRKLAGRKRLRDAFIDMVAEECLEYGWLLFTFEDNILLIHENVVRKYRNVPDSIINSYIDEDIDEIKETMIEEDDDDD